MIKRIILAFTAVFGVAQLSSGQTNLQVFYDFNRECITSTIEMFKGDNWGNTFFFIDYDYQLKKEKGTTDSPGSTYFEIARCLNFWQDSSLGALSVQVEYNGGVGTVSTPGYRDFYGVNHAFLLGLDYFLHSRDFNNTLNLKVLYKKFKNLEQKSHVQFTAVWGCKNIFGVGGLNFSGFFDVWWESKCVLLSEPQLWYGFGEHFNIGAEVEFSSNFAGVSGFKCRPCLGVKWVF